MRRNQTKLSLKVQPVLDTIKEDIENNQPEPEYNSLTRENSYENCQKQLELENAIEARNLIKLTFFEVQNINRRVCLLMTDMNILNHKINVIQQNQIAIIDQIVGK
ncbi:Hypothetical_protein [Hexamita inflata]|uniref:Hypothetical_protein n=1 Tax=Hexamita inflata TaxID=28002 RepID=A0AA86REY2_9EUKA|nr:Hypothetical protein HINF_LOCUS64849 [Hexamita inflata]